MGTNYYLIENNSSIADIIGKRFSAGNYCWDCQITLCELGPNFIHKTSACQWYVRCPICGGIPKQESYEESAVGRELGFNKSEYKKKTGVASCSSFTWVMGPGQLLTKLVRKKNENFLQDKLIKNEYNDKFSFVEFCQILEECPIQFYDNIGKGVM